MKIRKTERQNPDSYPYLDLKLFQNDRSGSVNNNYGSATLPRGILLTYYLETFIFQRNLHTFVPYVSGRMTHSNLSYEYNLKMFTSVTDLNLFLETIAARHPEQYKGHSLVTKVSSMKFEHRISLSTISREKGNRKR
jgi:hypothetical protein